MRGGFVVTPIVLLSVLFLGGAAMATNHFQRGGSGSSVVEKPGSGAAVAILSRVNSGTPQRPSPVVRMT
jgi:hypothetical protein